MILSFLLVLAASGASYLRDERIESDVLIVPEAAADSSIRLIRQPFDGFTELKSLSQELDDIVQTSPKSSTHAERKPCEADESRTGQSTSLLSAESNSLIDSGGAQLIRAAVPDIYRAYRPFFSFDYLRSDDANAEALEAGDDFCSICQAHSTTEAVTPCGHLFHPRCIAPFLDAYRPCPNCRGFLLPPLEGPEWATLISMQEAESEAHPLVVFPDVD